MSYIARDKGKLIQELQAQIQKMKCCQNCKHQEYSGLNCGHPERHNKKYFNPEYEEFECGSEYNFKYWELDDVDSTR